MKKRPFSVTILTMIVLFFILLNGARFYVIINEWNVLVLFNAHPGPYYMLALSLIWITIGSMLIYSIFRKNIRTPQFIYISTGLYASWFWIDRTLFQHRMNSLVFPIIGTCLSLLFIISMLKHQDLIYYFKRAGRL